MKLTKRKALEICVELWGWLAQHPNKEKYQWPGWKDYDYMSEDCPCCEYVDQRRPSITGDCNKACPIVWPEDYCLSDSSPYSQWKRSRNPRYALEIVKLAKEALERLEK